MVQFQGAGLCSDRRSFTKWVVFELSWVGHGLRDQDPPLPASITLRLQAFKSTALFSEIPGGKLSLANTCSYFRKNAKAVRLWMTD